MPEPDPATYVREPTHIDEYPYSQLTRSGEDALEVRPSGFSTLFSNHTFSRSYTPTSLLLKNMTAAHRERIEELSDSIIAVIPFLAGPRWEAKYQDKAIRALELFLRGIDFPDKGHVNLSMSIPASDKDRRDFGGPWVIILEDVSAAFRMWLLDLGLISLTEPGATFLIESFSKEKMSWVICNYTGSGVSENPDDIARALTEIKRTIWKREAIRKLIANYVDTRRNSKGSEVEAAALAQKSITQILDDLTSSWRLIFIKCNNKEGDPNPRLQLQGKPISNQAHEQREWLKTIRAIVVYAGFKQLKPDSKVIGCVGCKAETHPSWACPYPIDNTDRWLGPTADEYEKVLKNPSDWKQERRRINNDFSQSDNREFTILHGRGRGRGRGGFRGGGGRGRGGPEYPRGYSATRGRGHFGGYDYVG
ncbi:hypothetical protein LENED_008599 [Lentinula edodes]|uniref:Uncharacterized protein n=1 Tax=Lentinula edodes TaxID=5353 RepID=A0A1Q3EHK3_LENED|nr:hypothetical protein LENED_008599 [Lentinula edodes]